jgi:hypothetical protein
LNLTVGYLLEYLGGRKLSIQIILLNVVKLNSHIFLFIFETAKIKAGFSF